MYWTVICLDYPMKMNKEKMEKDEITDEHVDRVSVSTKPKLSRREIKKATNKERKIRNATGKRNADKQKCDNFCSNDMCEPSNTLLQRSCLDKSIENTIDKGCQLSKGFAVKDNHDNTDECFTGNTREDAKIRNCDKNQSTTSSSKSPKKSAHGGNNNENQEDISKISEFKIGEPEITEHTSKQSHDRHEQVVCSTKKPYVDYTFPTNDEYERNLRDSASTAHNLERKGHNKSLASGEKNDIEVKSAQAAGGCASKKEHTDETLTRLDKLSKCVFDVAKPVLQERLSKVLSAENEDEFGKFLINNIHYFYHQQQNQVGLTCKCITTGTSCIILTKVINNKKQGNLKETVFLNLYKNRYSKKCTNRQDRECLCVYKSKKNNIQNLDFNDLQFLILDCDRNIKRDQKRSLMTLVNTIRNGVCHRNTTLTDEDEKGLWEDLKETILCLCSPYTRDIVAKRIQDIDKLKTVTEGEFEALQKKCARLELEHDTEVEKQYGINEEQEQTNKDNTMKIGEMSERINSLEVAFSLFLKKKEQSEEAKSRIDVKVESSSILNEEKAVNELNQDDDSDDHGLHIESIKRNCLLLELKASPEIFENETTLKHAIMSLVKRIAKAGDIDTSVSSTINVKVVFNEPLKKDEEDVIRRMLSLSVQEKKHEKALHGFQYEASNSDNEDEDNTYASIYKGPIHLTEIPCQSCEEKDKQIQAYETKIKQHQNITEKKELQETSDGIPPGTIEPLSKPFCQCCEDKEKRIKSIKKQHQKEWQECQYNLDMLRLQKENSKLKLNVEGLQTKNSELKHITRGLKEENSKLKGLQEENSKLKHDVKDLKEEIIGMKGTGSVIPCRDDTDVPSRTGQLRMSLVSGPALHSYHRGPVIVRREETDVPSRTGQLGMSLLSQQAYPAYAGNSYPKAKGQKGLAVIVYSNRGFAAAVTNLQVFFEEMGFVVQCIDEKNYYLPYRQVRDGNFYCVFLVLVGPVEIDCTNIIRRILRKPGQPLIVMTDSSLSPSIFSEITEETDTLMVMPSSPFTGGSHQKPDFKPAEHNILDYFMKVTRSNRFTDIMDILTRMNKLYYYPVITFKSSLRKKFSFL